MIAWLRPMPALAALALAAASPRARAESLYDPATYRPLVADQKAYRKGDVLTVHVVETSSATTTTDTATQRRNNLEASLRLLDGKKWGASAGVAGEFAGGGATQRANRLLATLTVTVREVLPNGDLQVGGEQLLTVNDEKQRVNLSGRVRPQDVTADNVVLSTRLADASIDYAGEGDLSGRQRRSWWRKLLDMLGL